MKRAIAALAVVLFACTRTPPLQQLTLPDLSRVEPSVRAQINASYHALQSKKSDANAYGETGQLLLAAEYPDAAETCFLDAQALAPMDARWPYYLGHLYKTRGDGAKSVAAFE